MLYIGRLTAALCRTSLVGNSCAANGGLCTPCTQQIYCAWRLPGCLSFLYLHCVSCCLRDRDNASETDPAKYRIVAPAAERVFSPSCPSCPTSRFTSKHSSGGSSANAWMM